MTASIYPTEFLDTYGELTDTMLYPTSQDISLQEIDGAGLGVIAKRPFTRGDIIGAFTGPLLAQVAQHTLQLSPEQHLLDPYFIGYLMHSCNPNLVLDMHQRRAYCIRDISTGEPLTMDYASTEDILFRQFPCCCQSSNCRQWVTGRGEHVNADGLVHIHHLSSALPLANVALQQVNGSTH